MRKNRKRVQLPEETKRQLANSAMTPTQISNAYGVHPSTVLVWRQKYAQHVVGGSKANWRFMVDNSAYPEYRLYKRTQEGWKLVKQ